MKRRLDLIFPKDQIKEPVIYRMAKEFDVVFNIRRAKVTDTVGEMVLELEGNETALEKAVDWLRKRGIKADPVTHDTVEG
jgi:L-aspartate semialdehyde sulfurtransferase ferredoxin